MSIPTKADMIPMELELVEEADIQQNDQQEIKKKNEACPYCPKKMATNLIEQHKADCAEKRPYPCEKCTRRFKSAQNLEQHVRIHSNLRPYQCRFCEKNFSQKSHILQHERLHTGEKPYECEYCGEGFRQSHVKKSHEKNCLKRVSALKRVPKQQTETKGLTAVDADTIQQYQVRIVRKRSSPIPHDNDCATSSNSKTFNSDGPIRTMVVQMTPRNRKPSQYHLVPVICQNKSLSLDHPSLKYSLPTVTAIATSPQAEMDAEHWASSDHVYYQEENGQNREIERCL